MADGDEFVMGTGTCGEAGFFIAQPMTYMNDSGRAVSRIVNAYDVPVGQVLVVCDDSNLPLGKIRIRRSGSDGGHNGLASIIEALQSGDFPRLRIGIGQPPPDQALVDYVLERFSKEEEKVMQNAVEQAAEAIVLILQSGIEEAMNAWN
jgi:PTH1 family peptidyl-tRNA hydrolase